MWIKNTHIVLLSFMSCFLTEIMAQSNQPPTIIAVGDEIYCPQTQQKIVNYFNIVDPDDTSTAAFYIQISTGYISGDQLILTGFHSAISTSWNASQGKLSLTGSGGSLMNYSDLISAVYDIVFESSSSTPFGSRTFSFTIDSKNYLPSTGHYYEYVSDVGITWSDAKTAAEGRTYYGLQGYLATLTAADEAQLAGEQAAGAGWIGGSDAATEGVWKWETGPEAGMVFWNGTGNGSSPPGVYSNWNTGEPNQMGDEDYAHITAPGVGIDGSWNDLSNTGSSSGDYQPKGYIVEYGGMPGETPPNLSASTKLTVASIETFSNNFRCGAGVVQLSATVSGGTVLWFDSETSTVPVGTGENFTTPVIGITTNYYVAANGCLIGREMVVATVHPLPNIVAGTTFENCDEDGIPDGITDFNLNNVTPFITYDDISLITTYHLSYAEAESGLNAVNPSPFSNGTAGTVYARVENSNGCFQIATVILEVSTTALPPGYHQDLQLCDDDDTADGLAIFDLSDANSDFLNQLPPGQNLSVHYYRNTTDALLEVNEILPQDSFINEVPFVQQLIVRIKNVENGACYGVGQYLTLEVWPRPQFEVLPSAILCLNSPPTLLSTYNPQGLYSYEWFDSNGYTIGNTPSIEVSTGGFYSVQATSTSNCESFLYPIEVTESIPASITMDDVNITDDSENNTIEINNQNNNLGVGDYEFALDSYYGPYQDEPLFEAVEAGIHTIFVRDKNLCGITSLEVSVLGYPNFFTPNGDGYNDTWNVLGVNQNFYPSSLIYIYDRYGKLIAKVDYSTNGWDGLYNGTSLPSSDYWFSVQLTDANGNIRQKKGHFSLIRK